MHVQLNRALPLYGQCFGTELSVATCNPISEPLFELEKTDIEGAYLSAVSQHS